MQADIPTGTELRYHGATIGFIERVECHADSGQLEAFILRSGRSPSLLRIAAAFVQPDGPGRWRIDPDLALDSLEQEALDSGVLPPVGEHLGDAGATDPVPAPEATLGPEGRSPGGYEAPATG